MRYRQFWPAVGACLTAGFFAFSGSAAAQTSVSDYCGPSTEMSGVHIICIEKAPQLEWRNNDGSFELVASLSDTIPSGQIRWSIQPDGGDVTLLEVGTHNLTALGLEPEGTLTVRPRAIDPSGIYSYYVEQDGIIGWRFTVDKPVPEDPAPTEPTDEPTDPQDQPEPQDPSEPADPSLPDDEPMNPAPKPADPVDEPSEPDPAEDPTPPAADPVTPAPRREGPTSERDSVGEPAQSPLINPSQPLSTDSNDADHSEIQEPTSNEDSVDSLLPAWGNESEIPRTLDRTRSALDPSGSVEGIIESESDRSVAIQPAEDDQPQNLTGFAATFALTIMAIAGYYVYRTTVRCK